MVSTTTYSRLHFEEKPVITIIEVLGEEHQPDWGCKSAKMRNKHEQSQSVCWFQFRQLKRTPASGPVSLDLFCTRLPGYGPSGTDQCLLALKEDPEQCLNQQLGQAVPEADPRGTVRSGALPLCAATHRVRSRSSVSEVVEAYDELIEVALLVSNATGALVKWCLWRFQMVHMKQGMTHMNCTNFLRLWSTLNLKTASSRNDPQVARVLTSFYGFSEWHGFNSLGFQDWEKGFIL